MARGPNNAMEFDRCLIHNCGHEGVFLNIIRKLYRPFNSCIDDPLARAVCNVYQTQTTLRLIHIDIRIPYNYDPRHATNDDHEREASYGWGASLPDKGKVYIGRGACNIPVFCLKSALLVLFEIPLASRLFSSLPCLDLTGSIYVRP